MAKVKGSNPPYSDWEYTDEAGVDYLFGGFVQQALKEPYLSQADPETDITGQTQRGARPTQQGDGTPSQKEIRGIFRSCADLWNSLPLDCLDPATDPPTTSKNSVWDAKEEFGVVCSYYDLFMRCCTKWALEHDGDMPDGDCFPCESDCGCEGIAIGYTTQQMLVDEEQTLTVSGAIEGCVYSWCITSGGGSLNVEEGTTVIYTAPSTNASCSNNATISLMVDDVVCDSLGIAIDVTNGASWQSYFVVEVKNFSYLTTKTGKPNTGECDEYYWNVSGTVTVNAYGCSGALVYGPCEAGAQVSPTVRYDEFGNLCCTKNAAGEYYLCVPGDKETVEALVLAVIPRSQCFLGRTHGLGWWVDGSPVDKRTDGMKTAGCCPAGLL